MAHSDRSWTQVLQNKDGRDLYARTVRERDADVHAFLEFDPERQSAPGIPNDAPLAGFPFAVKDNIAVEGFRLSCGSRILEGLTAPYTATAVRRLMDAGCRVVGKTNLDEFGMGSSTENSSFGPTHNPWEPGRVPGGSSGGSAAAVAAGMVPFALGSDTGGSVRQPAAFCGVYGLKPTYGSVSRFGLVAYASSLEVIGVVSKSVDFAEKAFKAMRGADPMDQTSMDPSDLPGAEEEAARPVKSIGVLQGDLGLTPDVSRAYNLSVERLKKLGYTVREISVPTLEYVVPVYYTIATAEASSNLARFNGIRYGLRPEYAENPDELVRIARDGGFGAEVKLRVLLGTYVLRSGFQDQYYLRAQKIRTAVRNDFTRVFKEVDLVMMPVFPTLAFPAGGGEGALDAFQQKVADRFTSTANLTGLPALSFPVSIEDGLPAGMQFMAPPFAESRLFDAGRRMEEQFPSQNPPRYPSNWS
jgi:aspartyl-tRNA(Asn)/glutamyl-tRNA(Gln) amidotransferase subunit A